MNQYMADLKEGFQEVRGLVEADAGPARILPVLDALSTKALWAAGLATHWWVGLLRRDPEQLDREVEAALKRLKK